MPRREWSRPFPEIRERIVESLAVNSDISSDELVARTGLPLEDVISALRMLRHNGVLDFEPDWASEGVLAAAHHIRLRSERERQTTNE